MCVNSFIQFFLCPCSVVLDELLHDVLKWQLDIGIVDAVGVTLFGVNQ
jgi:hypothetical protein